MLRCAQHDSAVTQTDSWINLLNCIIAPSADNADEPIHPDTRRGRFIAPSADLSASVDIPLSGLLSKCTLSALAEIARIPSSIC